MRILVIGSEGQLARALAERALPQGFQTLFVGRPKLDLAVRGSATRCIEAIGPEAIINAAAHTAVDQAESEAERAFAINAEGAGEIARAAKDCGVPIIQISTDYVFDGGAREPYSEEAATAPLNVYGASKLKGEQLVSDGHPAHMIVRTSWIYSSFGANFVKTMLRLAAERDEVRVVDDQVGRPTSAHDLAAALLGVIERWAGGAVTGQGETYHAAGEGACSWADFAAAIFEISAEHGGPSASVTPIPTTAYPTPAARPAYSLLDTTKFDLAFGPLPRWRDSLVPVVRNLLGQ